MSVQLNHTIVRCTDKAVSARFYAELLGLDELVAYGPFLVVRCANCVSPVFADDHGRPDPQHYAFLVSEEEFDAIHGRLVERGLYWDDPDGHRLEIITVPYGGWLRGRRK